jgi:hypothetical protein
MKCVAVIQRQVFGQVLNVHKNLWTRIRHKWKQKEIQVKMARLLNFHGSPSSLSKSRQQALCAQLPVFLMSQSDSYIIDSKLGFKTKIVSKSVIGSLS